MSGEYTATPVELAPGAYAIPGATNTGFITSTGRPVTEVYIIDTGSKPEYGLFILKTISEFLAKSGKAFKIKAIINTHSHADHCGGNRAIQDRTGCEIWIPAAERGGMENTLLQGDIIWGGRAPLELRTSYYHPEQSYASRTISEDEILELSGSRTLSFINLPGHYYANFGVACTQADGRKILFAADAIFPRGELGRYWIPFMINPDAFMDSLDRLLAVEGLDCVIPGHGDFICENLSETVELNKIAVLSTKKSILDAIGNEEITFEELFYRVARENSLSMKLGQYLLIGSTIRSYIAAMQEKGLVELKMKDNRLLFSAVRGA